MTRQVVANFGGAHCGPTLLDVAGQSRLGEVGLGEASHGVAVEAWLISARLGSAWHGTARPGSLRMAWSVAAEQGLARLGKAVKARRGLARRARRGSVRFGSPGTARQVLAWHGWAQRVTARQSGPGKVRPGTAGQRRGTARRGMARQAWQRTKPGASAPGSIPNQKKGYLMAAKQSDDTTIQIDRVPAETIRVPILGTTPLIVHRFSEKAKRQMLDDMQGRKSPKEPKDPQAEYEGAFYHMKDGEPGLPVSAFKAATVGGARFYGNNVTMTALKQFVFFRGEIGDDGRGLARIDGEPRMREDVVTVGRGGTDLRYRPEFPEWTTTLEVVYVTSALTRNSVLSLIDAGGMGVGVGEWRPQRDGDFGTYRIDPTKEVEVIS